MSYIPILSITLMFLIMLAHGPRPIHTLEGPSEAAHRMLKAAERGDTEKVVDYILNKHVILNTKNNYGVSAIIFAANNGHVDLVEALLEIGADIEDRSNNWRTPLIWSSLWGHLPVVQLLVQKGANISAFDVEGMTPLLSAVRNGHMEVLEYLIDNGADVKVKNFYNGTALSIARTLGDSMMVQRLQPYFGDEETNPDPYNVLFSMLQRESAVFLQVLMEETGWIVEQTLHAVDFLARRGPEYMQPAKLGEVLHDVVANFPQYVEDAHNAVVRSQAFVQIELSGALYRLAERMPGAVEMVQSAGRSVVAFSQQQYSVFRKSDTANIFRQLGAFVLKTLDRNYSRKQRQAAAQTCAAGSSCAGAAPGVSEL